jgi:hypothetical protein
VLPFPAPRVARAAGGTAGVVGGVTPPVTRITPASDIARRLGQNAHQAASVDKAKDGSKEDLSDMEIPTFIRRQMD